jgi:molecular chaperone DnaK (HSP70)
MRLGIDFGTTRTRVAAVLKGNYPLVAFHGEDHEGGDWYPSLIAAQGNRLAFGWDAQRLQFDPDWELLPSFKRLLGEAYPEELWRLGEVVLPAYEWLVRFFTALRQDLARRSNLEVGGRERLEAMLGTPANANSNQRFLTLEAARQAGFEVVGMLCEPSAAGIEYARRYRQSDMSRRREHVAVYDLGGGTFDVAVVGMAGSAHDVLASEGISRLGGDDFDAELLALVEAEEPLKAIRPASLKPRLLATCREAKEALTANSRKLAVDLGLVDAELGTVLIPVARYAEACAPLIQQTIAATEEAIRGVLGSAEEDLPGLAAIYLVGGSSELPLLLRALRERFGRRVRKSPYPSAATAIGLAIAADQEAGYSLAERFTRHFGVWREQESGRRVVFDPIFAKLTPLPAAGRPPLTVQRRYRPAHNLGRFRFLECSHLRGTGGEPAGDLHAWREISFPFDPRLQGRPDLRRYPVERSPEAEAFEVQEEYRCDAEGIIQVAITNLTTGYAKSYRLRGTGGKE